MSSLADMFDYAFEHCGPVFQFSIFWDVSYSTKDPNIVKVRSCSPELYVWVLPDSSENIDHAGFGLSEL